MKSLLSAGRFGIVWLALGMTVVTSLSAATHDLTCYEIIEPSSDYVEDGVPLTPVVGIANLGNSAEPSNGFFPVTFMVVNSDAETAFKDSVLVNHIEPSESLQVEINDWTPESICAELYPIVEYELTGIVRLGEGESETDDNPSNDTIRRHVTCLLSHDVGVTDIELFPGPDVEPDHYNPGTEVTITATIENFGIHSESGIPVRCEIIDICADPDTLLYVDVQTINFLDWRGNEGNNPYTAEVQFPPFTWPYDAWFPIECRTELVGDNCPDDDERVVHINGDPCGAIGESGELPGEFNLKVNEYLWGSRGCTVGFALPRSSWVKLDVFDGCGRWTRSLANDIYQAGSHSLVWDLKDARGRKVSSGAYLVRMEADDHIQTQKIATIN